MNYFLKVLYSRFVFVATHILYNIPLKKRKVVFRNKFIRLNIKFFIVRSSNLFILWKRIVKYIFMCHFNTSIMLITKNVNVTVINMSDVIILIVDTPFFVCLVLIYINCY